MNLYRVMIEHCAPKDSQTGIFAYVVAKSDKDVYEWIKSCPKVNDRTYYSAYSGLEDDYDSDTVQEMEKEIIANQGIYYTDYVEDFCSNLYYGATLDYWELMKEDVDMNLVEGMIEVGIDVVIV